MFLSLRLCVEDFLIPRGLGVWSRRVVTLCCPLRRKKRYGNNASRQRPNNAANSSRASQRSKEKTSALAQRYGLSRTTVTKWRSRTTTTDAPMGPSKPKSTVLSPAEEAVIVEFRRRTLLPLDDVMGCLRESIPKLSRSSLHRCLQRHGISRLPASDKRLKKSSSVVGISERSCMSIS